MTRTTTTTALTLAAFAALSLSSATARAQGAPIRSTPGIVGHGVELRPFAGGFLPTGTQRDVLKDAAAFGGQLGWRFHENFALTGSFAWAPSKDRTTAFRSSAPGALYTGREEQLDVFGYDAGLEARLPIAVTPSWVVAPYVGAGGGARSYHYRDVSGAGTETNPVGYGALGIDVAPSSGPLGVRLEARDNVSGFKGLRGERAERKARNDVQLAGGVTIRF
jgi:hypothetical protein